MGGKWAPTAMRSGREKGRHHESRWKGGERLEEVGKEGEKGEMEKKLEEEIMIHCV